MDRTERGTRMDCGVQFLVLRESGVSGVIVSTIDTIDMGGVFVSTHWLAKVPPSHEHGMDRTNASGRRMKMPDSDAP